MTGPFAFSVSRYSHFDSGHYFFELVYVASACPGVLVNPRLLWKNFSYHLVAVPEPFAPGNLDTADYSFLRNTWLDSGYWFFDCSLEAF